MTVAATSHKAAFELGTRLLRKQRWRPAAWLLDCATKLAPDHWETHNNLAVALLKLQRWEDAARAAERAIRLDPAAVDSHDFLGIALLHQERWSAAVAAYERAIAVDPGRYDSHDRLGMALLRLERWEKVVETYDAALTLEPDRYTAHQRRGVALLQLGRWDDAAAAFQRAIALAEGNPAAAGELAGLYHYLASALARRGTVDARPMTPVVMQFLQRQSSFWGPENLGGDVFAIERWLEQLSAVPSRVPPGPTLLFVLDNDFGELTTVKYFLLGQELAARSTLLLPERLYAHNADSLPGRTHRYATVDDVLQAADRERPEIVFLCSAYLFIAHLGFTTADLERLVEQLRIRGCRIVTADPFMGRLSQHDARALIRFDVSRDHVKKLAAVAHIPAAVEQMNAVHQAMQAKGWGLLSDTERIFRDTYHLYPSYCDVPEDDAAESDVRNLAFFNDCLLRPAPSATADANVPHWLFILASADCDVQLVKHGDAFADIVARKLIETRAAGRHPILIAPAEFIDELLPRMATLDGIDVLPHCPFIRFMSLLLSAEHVFYWNVVSHSLLIRLFNQLPIVQFDQGHLVRTAPAIHDRIVGWYYQGWEPPIRDVREPLTLERVDGWAAGYRRQSARLVERFRRAPAPRQMIVDLMNRAPTPALQTSAGSR